MAHRDNTHLFPGLGPRDPEPPSRIKNKVTHGCCCDNEKWHRDKEDGVVIHQRTMLFPHFNNHCHFHATLDPAQDLHAFHVADHNCNSVSCTCKREGESMLSSQVLHYSHQLRGSGSSAKEHIGEFLTGINRFNTTGGKSIISSHLFSSTV